MPDFPDHTGLQFNGKAISVAHTLALGDMGGWGTGASTAWPSANLAIFTPVRVSVPVTVYQMVVGCGATGGGNFDVGIYDVFGNLLVSSGATAQSASNDVVCNVTDTRLMPGRYFFALAVDGTTNMQCRSASQVGLVHAAGIRNMASAYPLPSTATMAAPTSVVYPLAVGAWLAAE